MWTPHVFGKNLPNYLGVLQLHQAAACGDEFRMLSPRHDSPADGERTTRRRGMVRTWERGRALHLSLVALFLPTRGDQIDQLGRQHFSLGSERRMPHRPRKPLSLFLFFDHSHVYRFTKVLHRFRLCF